MKKAFKRRCQSLKQWKKITCSLLCCFFVAGCNKDSNPTNETSVNTVAIEAGDYNATIPFVGSSSVQQHMIRSNSLVDNMYIGTGLLEYAKQYFTPKSYTMREGQYLAYDELGSLLGRESDENPDGLNPGKDVMFDTGNGEVKAPVIVRDIYEIDFLKESAIGGVAVAVVLNRSVKDSENNQMDVTLAPEKLQLFAEEVARRLVTYMRKIPEIGEQVPIYIGLYKDTSSEEYLPGSYFSHAYFTGRSANFSKIDEKWVLFPSDEAIQMDGVVTTQFTQIKQSINNFLPDDVGMVGKGKFVDGLLQDLQIEIHTYAKTAVEAISLVQYTKSLLDTFSSTQFRIQVEISNQNKVIATMIRNQGEKAIHVNMLL